MNGFFIWRRLRGLTSVVGTTIQITIRTAAATVWPPVAFRIQDHALRKILRAAHTGPLNGAMEDMLS